MLSEYLQELALCPGIHGPDNRFYKILKNEIKKRVIKIFGPDGAQETNLHRIGTLKFPFVKMGNISSVDLFGIDELIILSFYIKNYKKYKNAVDIGSNLGLHSIVMSKCGFNVKSFEPDPKHFIILKKNLIINKVQNVKPLRQAVSTKKGRTKFVRVLGNTTSSHLLGEKNPYGKLQIVNVETTSIKPLFLNSDLIKIDAEGHEKKLILSSKYEDWEKTDAFCEIGNKENRNLIFKHLETLNIKMFSQKIGWNRAVNPEDLPESHKEGSVFISASTQMNWS